MTDLLRRPDYRPAKHGPEHRPKPDGTQEIITVALLEPLIVHEYQLLRIDRVALLTGLGRSTIYQLAGEGRFPCPVELAGTAVAWRAQEVIDWIKSRPGVVIRHKPTRRVSAGR